MNHLQSILTNLGSRKEIFARRAGILFIVLAVVLQTFSVIGKTQAEAAGADDMIPGGVGSKTAILSSYDKNTNNFRDVMAYNGITRAELAAMSSTMKRYYVNSSTLSWGWTSHFNLTKGEKAHSVAGRTIYSRPQSLWGYSWYNGWQGQSAKRGTFNIMSACGNLVTTNVPPTPTPTPKPAATCDALRIAQPSRNSVKLSASASGKNGAKISRIDYYVYDASGKVVASKAVSGSSNSVTFTISKTGAFTAKAFAITSVGNVTSSSCTGTFTIKEEQKPSISITKTVDKKKHDKIAVGTQFTYEITVTNTGNVDLKNAVVTDKAPSQVSLLKSSTGAVSVNTWTYTIPVLKVGESKGFIITAEYKEYASGTHKNTVCVDTPTIPGSSDGCDDATTETFQDIEVCDLNDNTIKTISKSEFDSKTMTTDQSKCGTMKVCVIGEKVVKTIAKNDFDSKTMTTDESQCIEEETSTPTTTTTVTELPKTGLSDTLSGIFGTSGLIGVTYAYIMSRRNLR